MHSCALSHNDAQKSQKRISQLFKNFAENFIKGFVDLVDTAFELQLNHRKFCERRAE